MRLHLKREVDLSSLDVRAGEQVALVEWLATQDAPFAAIIFGNPYAAALMPRLPALLLTYEIYDGMEAAVVRALAGEIPIGGRLPITLPGMFPRVTGSCERQNDSRNISQDSSSRPRLDLMPFGNSASAES
jgi:hypothetical protein